jgi:hypothetical protein
MFNIPGAQDHVMMLGVLVLFTLRDEPSLLRDGSVE